MAERFITMEQVRGRVALSKTEIYRKIKAGLFPKPVPLGPQKVAFLESEVAAWMEDRLRAREAGEGSARRAQQGRDAANARHGADT